MSTPQTLQTIHETLSATQLKAVSVPQGVNEVVLSRRADMGAAYAMVTIAEDHTEHITIGLEVGTSLSRLNLLIQSSGEPKRVKITSDHMPGTTLVIVAEGIASLELCVSTTNVDILGSIPEVIFSMFEGTGGYALGVATLSGEFETVSILTPSISALVGGYVGTCVLSDDSDCLVTRLICDRVRTNSPRSTAPLVGDGIIIKPLSLICTPQGYWVASQLARAMHCDNGMFQTMSSVEYYAMDSNAEGSFWYNTLLEIPGLGTVVEVRDPYLLDKALSTAYTHIPHADVVRMRNKYLLIATHMRYYPHEPIVTNARTDHPVALTLLPGTIIKHLLVTKLNQAGFTEAASFFQSLSGNAVGHYVCDYKLINVEQGGTT